LELDDNAGKFPCPICNRAFARSDLLNRHRKTHEPKQHLPDSHVTETFSSNLPLTDNRYGVLVLQQTDESKKLPAFAQSFPRQTTPQFQSSITNQTVYPYQPMSNPTPPPPPQIPQNSGLTSFVQATVTPQQFTPAENSNPTSWEGFMGLGNSLMGSYDADISWTLNPFDTASSSNYGPDTDIWSSLAGYPPRRPYPTIGDSTIQPDIDAVDPDDDDNNDWLDKVSKEDSNRPKASRIIPLQLKPISWDLVIEEARLNDLVSEILCPAQRICEETRKSLISTLNRVGSPKELACPEIDDFIFPPAEVLDYFFRLYFRYIQPRFPIIHTVTFDVQSSSPLLLIAMMFLGSSHSPCDNGRFSRMFQRNLRIACIRMQEICSQFVRTLSEI
jgi:hypothetical protein